jgi:hypothetical protein
VNPNIYSGLCDMLQPKLNPNVFFPRLLEEFIWITSGQLVAFKTWPTQSSNIKRINVRD